MTSPRIPNQSWQEKTRRGFHDDPTSSKHESDFRFRADDADGHGERHGYADADGVPVDGCDDGFVAPVDGERDLPAAVAVSPERVAGVAEAGGEVGAGAEHFAVAGYDDGFDAGVGGEERDDSERAGKVSESVSSGRGYGRG